ncbi:MAG: hypothetical protein F6K41_43195 [Symploca sp. SIO3E6]|nr:hypothetical protein [Caldora sp. SIO3E6]
MIRRKPPKQTVGESRWHDTPDFVKLAKIWKPDATSLLLKLIWEGYDLLSPEVLSQVDILQADDQLERELTQLLDGYIRQAMGGEGFYPFFIQHESYEMELRGTHRPKQYDLAFVWFANPRIKYPLEAKVLRSDKSVTEYVREITGNYLTCRYAPFSSEAGMLGYLLQGSSAIAFKNIATAVPCILSDHPDFLEREHKISDHERKIPAGKTYPVKFRCHHLLLPLITKSLVF